MTGERAVVFVVDDDPVQLVFLGGILRTAGYRVEDFDEPEVLLSRLSAHDRGCAVLDLRMPGLNGLELQQALAERGVLLPLIFVSGKADIPAVAAAMKRGAVDFLAKPVDEGDLCAVVARAVERDAASARARAARDEACARWMSLSAREHDVCRLFGEGLLVKQIAGVLGISQSTVQEYRASGLRKLRVSTAVDVARLIAQAGDEGAIARGR